MPAPTDMLTRPTASHRPSGLRARFRRRAQRAFTLAEVMMATVVFTMGILGVYAMMIKSYELVTLSRHRDNARALLISYSDQFLRLSTTEDDLSLRALFSTTGTGGDGLTWTDSRGAAYDGTGLAYMEVPLGQTESSQVLARISREVTYLDSTGTPTNAHPIIAAGWILQGTFSIQYDIAGRTQRQSLTVARSVK